MLITETTSDGRTLVRVHKDWHPGRIGKGLHKVHQPPRDAKVIPPLDADDLRDAYRIQTALLYVRNK